MSPASAAPAPAPAQAPCPSHRAPVVLVTRRPERTALHRAVRENLATFYAATESGFGEGVPRFMRKEFDGFVTCGVAARGFAHLKCASCGHSRLVSFSCRGRGFCPSCLGRRMASTALNLLEHVLPRDAPLRQWVLTLAHPLRPRLAYDGALLCAVARLFSDTVLSWYRRRMEAAGVRGGRSGAVTVVQRVSSDLRANPHLHGIFLDGVFVAGPDGERPVFHALPHLSTTAVADVLQLARARILRLLRKRGVIEEVDAEAFTVSEDLAARDPVLGHLAAASVSGLPPAGPARRKPLLVPLPGRPGVQISAPLSVKDMGFSLHAATHAGAADTRGREALVKYVLRPPLANDRLQITDAGLVRLTLKKPFRDGTSAVEMPPLALLSRLAVAIPAPRRHTVLYSGVIASAAKFRPLVVPPPPPPPPEQPPEPDGARAAPSPPPPERPATHRCGYRPYLELLARTFGEDRAACERCGGQMRLIALVKDPASVRRFLAPLGEPADVPPLAPARGPPFFAPPRPSGASDPCAPEPTDESS